MDDKKPAAKGSTTAVQTRSPLAGFSLSKDRHYVIVERTSQYADWYESPLDSYMDKVSPTTGGPLYKIETEDRKHTGSARKVLISCSLEDYKIIQEEYEAEARGKQSTTKTVSKEGDVEHEEQLSNEQAFTFKPS